MGKRRMDDSAEGSLAPGALSIYRSARFLLENLKKYLDFDFEPLKNTQIAIFRTVLGKMASIMIFGSKH